MARQGRSDNYHVLSPSLPVEPIDASAGDNREYSGNSDSYREVFTVRIDAVIDPESGCIVEQQSKMLLAESDRYFPSTFLVSSYPFFDSIKRFPLKTVEEHAAYFQSRPNYYHWMVESLGRMLLFRSYNPHLPIYVAPLSTTWQEQALAFFGLEVKIVDAPPGAYLHFPRLQFVSYAGIEMQTIDRTVLRTIRSTVRQQGLTPPMNAPYLYISRKKANHRRIANEDSLRQLLEKKFGFVTICAEDFSVAEQLALFANARVVIAIHGPALTNTMACEDALIIELANERHLINCYCRLANSGGNRYILLTCKNLDPPVSWMGHPFYGYADIEVDLNRLEALLETREPFNRSSG